jgi:hypothetical protein
MSLKKNNSLSISFSPLVLVFGAGIGGGRRWLKKKGEEENEIKLPKERKEKRQFHYCFTLQYKRS